MTDQDEAAATKGIARGSRATINLIDAEPPPSRSEPDARYMGDEEAWMMLAVLVGIGMALFCWGAL